MSPVRWSVLLALLFFSILAWYLVYTEQFVRAFRAETTIMTRMYAEIEDGLASADDRAADEALIRLQEIVLESGVPLVLTAPGDTVLSAVNLPFEADVRTPEGQERVRNYARRLDQRRPPVGDSTVNLVHFGDTPELRSLRWIPWFQVAGLALTLLTGFLVLRAQREAATDRAWTSMARELAHQLGTPISSLKGWHELLALPRKDRPSAVGEEEIAHEILTDVDRLERVSRRFELIGRQTPLEPIRIDRVMSEVDAYLRTRMPTLGPGVRLNAIIEPDLPAIRGNAVLLAWALENVVKNALDAVAGRGGSIEMRAFPEDSGWVTLQVSDTGPGVDPAIRDRLFEPGATTKSGGWGVGLSLARRIIRRVHKGSIELARTGPRGSTFEIRLPAERVG